MNQRIKEWKRVREDTTKKDGDFNIPLSIMERKTRQRISKETADLT